MATEPHMMVNEIEAAYESIVAEFRNEAELNLATIPRHWPHDERVKAAIRIEREFHAKADPFYAELGRIKLLALPTYYVACQ